MATYFISGHRDLTWQEFAKWYAPVISMLYRSGNQFVVGDCEGCDEMARELLRELQADYKVYYASPHPLGKYDPFYAFKTDIERDEAMTKASDYDLAYLRDNTKWDSGTAQNILRRLTKNYLKD